MAFPSKPPPASSRTRQPISYKDRVVDGEKRRHTIGVAGGIMIVLAVPVVKHKNVEEEMRIISARKADRRERALYESHR